MVAKWHRTSPQKIRAESARSQQADEMIQRERNKLKSILDVMQEGVFIINSQHEIEYANPAVENEIGPLRGHKCYQYFHGSSKPCAWCGNGEVFAGKRMRSEWHNMTTGRIYDVVGIQIQNGNGSISKLGILHDITRFKQEEGILRESERFNRSVLSSMDQEIAVLDKTGTILAVNEAWDQFALDNGAESIKSVGVNYIEICRRAADTADELARQALEGIESVMQGKKESFYLSYCCNLPDKPRWFLMKVVPLKRAEGGAVVSHIDITYRKVVEESLRQNEERYKGVVETQTEMVCRFNPDTTLTFVNRACARHFRKSSEDLIGTSFLTLIPPEAHGAIRAYLRSITPADNIKRYEREVLVPDGSLRWQDWTTQAFFDPMGRVVEFQSVGRDTTEIKHAEFRDQSYRDELAHVAHVTTVGGLTSFLVHELTQPLTSILSHAQAAQRFLAGEEPRLDEVRSILHGIVQENKRANKVIHRLRDLFKKSKFDPRRLDINDTIHQAMDLIRTDKAFKKLPIVTELDPDLPPALGDRIHLQQVLLNLMHNGSESMAHLGPRSRKLIIRTEREGDKYVKVSVKDFGGGIAVEPHRLFEPFYTTKTDGMGMGLSICRFIIEAHEGILGATNNPDGGATFYFKLPLP